MLYPFYDQRLTKLRFSMGVSELLQLLGDAIDDPEEGELDRLLKLHKVN